MDEFVILVDEKDNQIGIAEKLEAHQKGLLHRAFSIFIFNAKDELLLQKRADTKYHSGGLWTNTCCGHPRPNENLNDAANRRLEEEMGITCALENKFTFSYSVNLDNNLIENEIDHVLSGRYSKNPTINPVEVMEYKWQSIEKILEEIKLNPSEYTEWFKICFDNLITKVA